jgi:hypothetical protein
MWDNLVGRQIRRGARRLLLWNLLLLIVLVFVVACGAYYWYNFALGPFPIDRETLVNMKSTDGLTRYYVAVTADAAADTGGRLLSVQKDNSGREISRSEQAKYVILMVDGRALIAKTGMSDSPFEKRRVGHLQPLPPDVRRDVLSPIEASLRQNQQEPLTILPVMLDATPFRTPGWLGVVVIVPLAALGIWNVLRAVRRIWNPERSPIAKGLLRYGDPAEVANRIEQELQAQETAKIGFTNITKNWMVYAQKSRLQVVHLGDVAWVYKAVTKHLTNGVPTGTTFAGVMCDLAGTKTTVPMSDMFTHPFLLAVQKRVPWVLMGFDPRLDLIWRTDRQQMADIIEKRRREIEDSIQTNGTTFRADFGIT